MQFSTRGKSPRVMPAYSLPLCSDAAQELDDSVLDEITVEDLSQAGLNEQQGSAFIARYLEYLHRATPEHVVAQIATVSESSAGSSSFSNRATIDIADSHLSNVDARIVWRCVTRHNCLLVIATWLLIFLAQMAERRRQ
jgi:hypothetical protein